MMYDKQNLFLDKVALATSGTGTFLANGSYDLWGGVYSGSGTPADALGNTIPSDAGAGRPKQLFVQVLTAITGPGASVEFDLVMADDQALQTNLVVLTKTAAIAVASLVQGYLFALGAIPIGTTKRFIGAQYVVTGAALTGGIVLGFISESNQTALPIL